MMSAEESNASSGDTGVASRDPHWLTYMNKEMTPDADEEERDFLGIMRDMLQAPTDRETAVSDAVQRVREYYSTHYTDERKMWRHQKDHATWDLLNSLAVDAFELAGEMSVTDVGHQRLADFLIGFEHTAPNEFDPQNPQLLFDKSAYGAAARNPWNHYSVSNTSNLTIDDALWKKCEAWVSVTALLGKLLKAGVLTESSIGWSATDVEEGLQKPEDCGRTNRLALNCKQFVAAQLILLAGDILAREAQTPSSKLIAGRLSLDIWKRWADRMGEIARETPEDAEWGLKDAAEKAHAKMISLHPELFQDASVERGAEKEDVEAL